MADFEEEYEEPFYQKVTEEETGKLKLFILKLKENPLFLRPFVIQTAVMILLVLSAGFFPASDALTDFLDVIWLQNTLLFFIIITILTIKDIKTRVNACYKIALPNILVQTDLFFCNTVLMLVLASENGWGLLFLTVPHIVFPVIPAFIVVLFVIGCVIDKRIAKKGSD